MKTRRTFALFVLAAPFALAAPAVAQFPPGAAPRAMSPARAEMMRKVTTLRNLRRIQAAHLTAADIAAALPILKAIREEDRKVAARAEVELDRQIHALLAAGPDTTVPNSAPSPALEQTAAQARAEQQKQWDSLANAIGAQKVRDLQTLMGHAPPSPASAPAPGAQTKPGGGPPVPTGQAGSIGSGPKGKAPDAAGPGTPVIPTPSAAAAPVLYPGTNGRPSPLYGPPIPLDELIDLLQQKLDAMQAK